MGADVRCPAPDATGGRPVDFCELERGIDTSGLDHVVQEAGPDAAIDGAMALATEEATRRPCECMVFRDTTAIAISSRHSIPAGVMRTGRCPGCVDYGVNDGATSRGYVDAGRFVFFFAPVDL